MTTQRIILGETSQLLRHVPMGPVSGASFTFEDTNRSVGDALRVIASGPAATPSWSLTSTATAGPTQRNPGRVPVAATTGASIGAAAVIVAPDGSRELFEIAALSADTYVEAASSLAGVYPVGSMVYGVGLTAAVPDDFAVNTDRFKHEHALRVVWEYTLDGALQRKPEIVEWTRHTGRGDELAGAAVLWLSKAYPMLRQATPEGADLDTIASLMCEEIANDLRARTQKDPSTLLVGDQGRALLCARILAHMGEIGWSPAQQDPGAWEVRARGMYQQRLDNLTVGVAGHNTAATDREEDVSQGTPDQTYRHIFIRRKM